MNKAECDACIMETLTPYFAERGFVPQKSTVWVRFNDPEKTYFDVIEVGLGKSAFYFHFGFGSLHVPYCEGYKDLKLQKHGRLAHNLHIFFDDADPKGTVLWVKWLPGCGESITPVDLLRAAGQLLALAESYRGRNTDFHAFHRLFHEERTKLRQFGLPFTCHINHDIANAVMARALGEEGCTSDEGLSQIYKGEGWRTNADAAAARIRKTLGGASRI